ncbi:hypothetical protein NDN13_10065 [Acinetobacter sp. C32I]|uniref:hypothetical protein n=1 Tax=Acinetobacter sp. C32I TaxID=2950074 RepID=UPI0020373EAE|nr:hypothetical protein [Acinetobacter sp. C32I]USA55497.1 hypothetical protein NDN13_10065 [Acinetobacter sp. C32I]
MSDRLTPRNNIVHGYFALTISLIFLMFSAFPSVLFCLILGALLIGLGYVRVWKKDRIPNPVVEGAVLLIILFSFWSTSLITDYINQNAPRKTICGWAKNIEKPGRSSGRFLLVNDETSQSFSYTHQMQIQPMSEMCLEYSLNEHFGDYPYIHEIYPRKSDDSGKEIK